LLLELDFKGDLTNLLTDFKSFSSAGAMLGIPHQYQTIDLTYPYLFDKYKTFIPETKQKKR
jgi:hypothetical protein